MQQEAARIADEQRIQERDRRRVARELGIEYVEPVIVADPEPEPVTVQEPEPERFDESAIRAIFDKLIDAALRR